MLTDFYPITVAIQPENLISRHKGEYYFDHFLTSV